MHSSDDSAGRALLRKWQNKDIVIRIHFETAVTAEVSFTAFGKIAELTDRSVRIEGKGFDLACDLATGRFEEVASEELLLSINPSLVGKQPETLTLVFYWNERCVLTRPSALPA